jgi:hypothetical protein
MLLCRTSLLQLLALLAGGCEQNRADTTGRQQMAIDMALNLMEKTQLFGGIPSI